MLRSTSDLYDIYGEQLESCSLQLRQFGARAHVAGEIVTFRSSEDNMQVKSIIREAGNGRVLVIDTAGSMNVAMFGDNMAAVAAENGWAALICNGAVRDVDLLAEIPIAVKALGSNPRRSLKSGDGERNVSLSFGGATFTPNRLLVSDNDGIVVLPEGTTMTDLEEPA
ncbi:ribonuclease E activity regulator RraA [Brevibacterium limosum]|uniref:ribonuclease E activity regulator RraA n=1 Tax=Brevibacterium limosum TaxID=2697565 RepID=UPI001421478E|nr:ribonuclease E activity regulator RraA [Brevibacterium limosum]